MEAMLNPPSEKPAKNPRQWMALVAFLLLAAVMYTSIMYKIINYGP